MGALGRTAIGCRAGVKRSRKDEGSVRQQEQPTLRGLSNGLHTGNSTEESTFGSDVLISNPEKECQNIILAEV